MTASQMIFWLFYCALMCLNLRIIRTQSGLLQNIVLENPENRKNTCNSELPQFYLEA